MKSIVIVVKNLTSGGAEKQSVLLAKALAGDYIVYYVILNDKYQEPKYLKLLSESPEIRVVAFSGSLYSRFAKFCKYLKIHKIEFVFSYLTAANFYAIAASRLTGVKRVYTGIRNAYLPPKKLIVDRFLCNHLASKAILNCYSGEKYFREKDFLVDKMIVIPNCFENIRAPKNSKNKNERLTIISVGRFVEQKDYFTALRAIDVVRKKYSDILFKIVGYGEMEKEIRAKVVELNLSNNVEIYIDPKNIAELLEGADIYLSTSVFEGTSNSIMEAMNADLPIVATNVGDNYQLILDKKSGFLVSVGNFDEIADRLVYLLESEVERNVMGSKSKEHLIENYSVDKFRIRYKGLIDG